MAPLRASVHQPLYCTCAVLYTHTVGTAVTPGVCVLSPCPLPQKKTHLTKVRALSERNKNVGTSRLKISPADPQQNKADFSQCVLSMCTYVIYSAAETSGQLYSPPPPQPLFTTPANHISSIIHFYSTHRITIMITKITTHINIFFTAAGRMNEWMSEWMHFLSSLCSSAEAWSMHPFPFNCDCSWYWFMASFDTFYLG